MTRSRLLSLGALASASVVTFAALVAPGAAVAAGKAPRLFDRTATYPVYLNVPAGVDPRDETVAEISAISPDGDTVIYTDALGQRIGFVDIADPHAPVGRGTIALSDITEAPVASPTSVAAYGDYVLVVVDTTDYDLDLEAQPADKVRSGELVVVDAASHEVVRTIDLGGQPDSIDVGDDGAYAAIAMENQRNEDLGDDAGTGEEGDIPQAPAGFVQTITLNDDPATWSLEPVALTNSDGSALAEFVAAGIAAPTDPEPEFVSINRDNQLAVTLQENNGVVIVDLPTREIVNVFSAGVAHIEGVDVDNDLIFDATATIDAAREPDSIGWIGDRYVATANEGDWRGGSRGWTVFDAMSGEPVWDAGNSFEQLAMRYGLFNDDRADNKGAEPEGLAITEFGGRTLAFVASERSNFVAVYDLADPTAPEFLQILFSTNGPEGILPVPSRDLLVVSSEEDDAGALVRSAINLYELGKPGAAHAPSQPSIVSADTAAGAIGWQALGALSGVPGDKRTLLAASDVAVSPATLYTVDVTKTPAVISSSIPVVENGAPVALDVEGVAATSRTGGWLAVEGVNGADNVLKRYEIQSGQAVVLETVSLPAEVAAHIKSWGFEGVTVADGAVWVAIQRPLWVDPTVANAQLQTLEGNVARIGRYDPDSASWSFYAYPLEATTTAGDWIGLSEITAVDDDTLAVIERDKLNGPAATIKRVYTVDLPASSEPGVPLLEKELAIDVLPALQAVDGWTQEKLEGFTIGADGFAYAVTDNDGVQDATGETVFLRLGSVKKHFDR